MNGTRDPIRGRYFATGASASIDAELTVDAVRQVSLRFAETGERRRFDVTRISDRLAGVTRKVTFADSSVFETGDDDAVDAAFAKARSFSSRLARLERSLAFAAVTAVVTLALIVGVFRYGLPVAAHGAAYVTPVNVTQAMDTALMQTLNNAVLGEMSRLDITRASSLHAMFDELHEASGFTDIPLRLVIRDGGRIGPNALALPGGTIVLTDQLVRRARGDDEIAGVLAHEIAHVELRHSLRQLYRVLGVGFMIAVVGGDTGQIFEDVVGMGVVAGSLSYSRAFEIEADMRSAEIMIAAGRDPLAFLDLLDRIVPGSGEASVLDMLSTHPANDSRREAVERHVETLTQGR